MPRTHREQINLADEHNPRVQEAIQLLWLSPSSKKDIANQTGLDIGQVHKIYELHFVNKKRNHLKDADKMGMVSKPTIVVTKKAPATTTSVLVEADDPEKKKNDQNVKDQPEKKEYISKKISDDIILAMCSDVEHGMLKGDVAKKYNISISTVVKYCRQFGLSKSRKSRKAANSNAANVSSNETTTDTATNTTTESDEKLRFVRVNNSCIRTQLINGRHDMPVSKYIFETVEGNNLFNFEWYDNVVRNWIVKNIPKKDNVWSKYIDCYVTGLPAASIAVTKICEEMKVNLTFSHFNNATGRYEKQVIFDKYPVANTSLDPSVLGKFYEDGEIFVYSNTSIEELSHLEIWYAITKRKLNTADNTIKTYQHYLLKNYNDIFNVIGDFIKDINNESIPLMVSANTVVKGPSDYIYKDTILQSKNKAFADFNKSEK